MAKVKIFNRRRTGKERAIDSLELSIRSLQLVKKILRDAKEFWVDTAKFIAKKLIPVSFITIHFLVFNHNYL